MHMGPLGGSRAETLSEVAETPWGLGRADWPHPVTRPWGPLLPPAVLLPLLEYCSVRPDAAVATHRFFGPEAEIR